ncbi:hypothetical protein B0I35DRAFT_447374, partial [Stachybotrys elegans]
MQCPMASQFLWLILLRKFSFLNCTSSCDFVTKNPCAAKVAVISAYDLFFFLKEVMNFVLISVPLPLLDCRYRREHGDKMMWAISVVWVDGRL